MENGHQKHEEPEMEMRSQQLKASLVLLLCCSLAQAQPIVDGGMDSGGTEDCKKEECVNSSDPEIYIQWDLEAFDFTTQNNILEDGLENSIEEEGVKNAFEDSGAASIATEQLELLLSSNSLEGDEKKEQSNFLSGLDIDNGMEDCEEQFGTLCNTWLDFVSWSSGYQKQIQEIMETEETDDPEDSVQSFCSLPMDEGSCASKNPIFSWFHNPTSGNCEPFWFSGCGGNQNNFETLDDCEKACSSAGSVDIPLSWIR